MSNSLDPDHAGSSVSSDLGPNFFANDETPLERKGCCLSVGLEIVFLDWTSFMTFASACLNKSIRSSTMR